MEAMSHDAVIEQIVDGHQAHPLMMRHEGFDDAVVFERHRIGDREINGFIKAISAVGPFIFKGFEVKHCLLDIILKGEHGRIGRYDLHIPVDGLKPELGYAKCLILIILICIEPVVLRLGYPPGDGMLPGVSPLLQHGGV